MHSSSHLTCHFCEDPHCTKGNVGTCSTIGGWCFTSLTFEKDGKYYMRGCDGNGLTCQSKMKKIHPKYDFKCCRTNLCNNHTFPNAPEALHINIDLQDDSSISHELPINQVSNQSSMILLSFGVLFLICGIFLYLYKKRLAKRQYNNSSNYNDLLEKEYLNSDYVPEVKVSSPGDSTLREVAECSMTSGSGSGYPVLIQRTFAKQINRKECIGKGRYGEVWKGIFYSEEVAVKIFFTRDEASWQREIEIYSINLLKHENILPFIGSDVTSVHSCTQLWLVTAYCEGGSLFDFLNLNIIEHIDDLLSMMISIISGLSFLHKEVTGTQNKPAIAHRDIKSKNILMKSSNTCCIADFGLAVTKQKTGSLDIAYNYRVGTKRYMAPEVLDGTLNENNFDSYTQSDIYSLSLVMWEMIRRVKSDQHSAFDYQVPYQNRVPSDPSFDDMKKVVCIEEYRPEIPAELEQQETLRPICNIIRETWLKIPASRLSALRIKKSLFKLKQSITEESKQ